MKEYRLLLTKEALDDLKEARAWYKRKNEALPKRFMQQVKITMEHLQSLPVARALRYKDVRIAQVAVFPYAIHYIIENNTVVVLAIHHTAIDPDKWQERRK